MKKLFLMAVAAMALTACGGNTANTEENAEGTEELNTLIETVQNAASQVDDDTKALIEKVTTGEATEEEKTTLLQKLKAIGASVVTGESTVEGGVESAKEAVENSKEEAKDLLNKATDGTVEKVEAAKEKVEDAKQKAEDVKNAANSLKDAVNALKK